jgi:hypothetical protein
VRTPVSSAETSAFQFQIEEVVNGEAYPIEGNSQGVSVRTQAQVLANFEFESSSRQVFSPFDATVSTRFSGMMKAANQVVLVYPDALTVRDRLTSQSSQISCSAIINGNSYNPSCSIDTSKRRITFTNILSSNKDFAAVPNGALLQFTVKGVFLNPADEQPVNVGTSVDLEDGAGYVIASYDAASEPTLYSAEAV